MYEQSEFGRKALDAYAAAAKGGAKHDEVMDEYDKQYKKAREACLLELMFGFLFQVTWVSCFP
jgi:4-aminobutyrate aminotransferase-like enzyme